MLCIVHVHGAGCSRKVAWWCNHLGQRSHPAPPPSRSVPGSTRRPPRWAPTQTALACAYLCCTHPPHAPAAAAAAAAAGVGHAAAGLRRYRRALSPLSTLRTFSACTVWCRAGCTLPLRTIRPSQTCCSSASSAWLGERPPCAGGMLGMLTLGLCALPRACGGTTTAVLTERVDSSQCAFGSQGLLKVPAAALSQPRQDGCRLLRNLLHLPHLPLPYPSQGLPL